MVYISNLGCNAPTILIFFPAGYAIYGISWTRERYGDATNVFYMTELCDTDDFTRQFVS